MRDHRPKKDGSHALSFTDEIKMALLELFQCFLRAILEHKNTGAACCNGILR